MLRFCSALVLALSLVAAPLPAATLEGQARVIDGDTLEVAGRKVRLFGIDAPEMAQVCDRNGQVWACGHWARDVLVGIVRDGAVSCTTQGTDRYRRAIALCDVAGRDLGRAMVAQGAARAYLRYSDLYAPAEARAQRDRQGIWAARMQSPEVFRHPVDVHTGCLIKGNVSKNGRIFHLPGQRDYAATRINPARGEAWFCTASAAQKAGFRAATR